MMKYLLFVCLLCVGCTARQPEKKKQEMKLLPIWRFKPGFLTRTLAMKYGYLYGYSSYTRHGFYFKISMKDGSIQWKVEAGNNISAPPGFSGEFTYVFDTYNGLQMIDSYGKITWQEDVEGYEHITPVGWKEKVFLNSAKHGLACFDTRSRTMSWKMAPSENTWEWPMAPALAGDILFTGVGNRLLAVDLTKNSVKWQLEYPESQFSSVSVSDTNLYAGVYNIYDIENSFIAVIDARTGTLRWKQQCNYDRKVSPVLLKDVICFYSSHEVVCLDARDGGEKWKTELMSYGVVKQFVRVGSFIGFCNEGDEVCLVDAEDGGVVFRQSFESEAPVLLTSHDEIFIATNRGAIYKIVKK